MARLETVEVTADGEGLVSHAGVALVVELSGSVWVSAAARDVSRSGRGAAAAGGVLGLGPLSTLSSFWPPRSPTIITWR